MNADGIKLRRFFEHSSQVTTNIVSLAAEILPTERVRIVPVSTATWARENECFAATSEQVAKHGGKAVVGWRFAEWPRVILEAEFHSVWRAPGDDLIDVSWYPSRLQRCVFLPDFQDCYDGVWQDNIRRPLCDDSLILEFLSLARQNFCIQSRYQIASGGVSDQDIIGPDLEQLVAVQRRKAFVGVLLADKYTGRNDLCVCRSGRKRKHCHPHPIYSGLAP